jgi:hypothetical protein
VKNEFNGEEGSVFSFRKFKKEGGQHPKKTEKAKTEEKTGVSKWHNQGILEEI